MAELIALLCFLGLALGITYYGYKTYSRPARVYERLGDQQAPGEMGTYTASDESQNPLVHIIEQVGQKVPVSPADATVVKRYLMAAGFRSDNAVTIFYGCKALLCVVMLVLALLVRGYISDIPGVRLVILAAAGVAGWFGPALYLERLIRKRQEEIRLSLPDALDLMVVCVEAGHGLDQAFVRVSKELALTHPAICEEFSLVNLEMRAGKRRAEALHNLADRTGEDELRKLVAILIQADRFGTSIGESLRTHADFMRIKRRQDAEERANKVGVKLVFPIFFCILPAMFVITAGPGVLSLVNNLLPLLRQMHK